MTNNYQIVVSDGFEQTYVVTKSASVKDYDGYWQQVRPYNRRLIRDEVGYFKLAEQTSPGGSEDDKGIPVMDLYYTNGRRVMTLYVPNGLHLGLVGNGVIHTKRTFLHDSKDSIDPRLYEPPLVYKVFSFIPDLTPVWAGMAFKTEGQLLTKEEALVGFMINVVTGEQRYFVVKSERWGPEFGGSIGVVLCIATGFKDIGDMKNLEIGGSEVSISLGYNWNTFLMSLKDCPKSLNLFQNVPKVISGLKAIEAVSNACLKHEDWTNWAKLLVSDTECDTERTLSFFEVPGPGIGLDGLRVCNTVGKVVAVGSHEEICRYASRAASASRGPSSVKHVSY